MIPTPKQFDHWAEWNRKRLEEEHRLRMERWEYLGSEEFQEKVAKDILDDATASITPPWEEE